MYERRTPLSFRAKGQDYQIFWPEKSEFVRIAASCNATIVPFAAIGSADRYGFVALRGLLVEDRVKGRCFRSSLTEICTMAVFLDAPSGSK